MAASVIIVNWNGRDLLEKCIGSLIRHCSTAIGEIILIDNCSEDDSVPLVRQTFPQVRVIENKRNLGFVKACNLGIRAASHPYVLLLNPDTWVINDCIADMLSVMDYNSRLAAVGPKVLDTNMSLQKESLIRYPSLLRYFTMEFHLGKWVKGEVPSDSGVLIDVDAVSGCCILLRKAALDQVGGLDENLWAYLEETDLCLRLKKEGWRVCWLPNTFVVHVGGESFRKLPLRRMVEQRRSQYYFFKKHYRPFQYVIYTCAEILICSGKWLLLNLLFRVTRNEYYGQRKAGFSQIGQYIVHDSLHSYPVVRK